MKAATVAQIKKELKFRSSDELETLCLRLARFKKENKELLTYLLFEAEDEAEYILHIREYITQRFNEVNTDSFYYIKKSIRKILRELKKFIRYSGQTETEVELLLFFCEHLAEFEPTIQRNRVLMNVFERQTQLIRTKIDKLHPDLQFDYENELTEIIERL